MKFEYKCVQVRYSIKGVSPDSISTINEMGKDGWELVCSDGANLWFKRAY